MLGPSDGVCPSGGLAIGGLVISSVESRRGVGPLRSAAGSLSSDGSAETGADSSATSFAEGQRDAGAAGHAPSSAGISDCEKKKRSVFTASRFCARRMFSSTCESGR